MAASINKVILIGNLGRDPEVRFNPEGAGKIVTLSVATSESWKDKASGEHRDRTEWHKVVIFNEKISDICEKYLKKGSKVYLEGQLQTRKWTDQQGQDRYTTEIILKRYRGEITMLDTRGDPEDKHDIGEVSESFASRPSKESMIFRPLSSGVLDFLNDEVPF